MNKPEKPTVQAKAHQSEGVKKAERAPEEKKASAGAVETFTDIANRSTNLFHLYEEKLWAEDGYQVIEPRTVTASSQELLQKQVMDPAPILEVHEPFRTDLELLRQRTAMHT